MNPPNPPSRSSGPPGSSLPLEGSEAADDRFRRPDRPAAFADGRGSLDATADGPGAAYPPNEGETSLVPDAARAVAEPLAALAAAFHANAEALRRSQEVQADLQRALARADRTEVVVQSTGALNETFRGLTTVQRALVDRIADTEREARAGRLFLPALVLAALAVVGGVAWITMKFVDRWRAETVGTQDVATQLAAQFDKGVDRGRADAAAAADLRVGALDDARQRAEEAQRAAEKARDAVAERLRTAEGDLASMRTELQAARIDPLRVRALEDEANRLRIEVASKDADALRLGKTADELRRENRDLRERLAMGPLARVAARDEVGSTGAPETPFPPNAAPAPTDPTATRDRGAVDGARTRLNDLLQSARKGRPDYLQVLSIGSVGAAANDVVVARYAGAGRLLSSVRAREMRVAFDRTRQVVEMNFRDGSIEYGDRSAPFPDGAYSVVVAEGDAVSAWAASALPFVSGR